MYPVYFSVLHIPGFILHDSSVHVLHVVTIRTKKCLCHLSLNVITFSTSEITFHFGLCHLLASGMGKLCCQKVI